jgi:hypothetical protein
MTALMFMCPKTGRSIESGLETDRASLSIRIRVRCPHCWEAHDLSIRDDGRLAWSVVSRIPGNVSAFSPSIWSVESSR